MDNTFSGGNAHVVVQAQNVSMSQPVPSPPVPAMLLTGPDDFVDRNEGRAWFDAITADLPSRRSPLFLAVTGAAGVGKTALVLHSLAGRLGEFPGGHLFADMSRRGLGDARDVSDVLADFLSEFRIPRDEMPSGLEARAARFRSLTSAEPCVVILENVVNPGQVWPLIPGHPASLVVVTSRFGLSGLRAGPHKVNFLQLDVLDDAACADLFQQVAEEAGECDDELLRAVIGACAGLPGAVRIAGARAADPLDGGIRSLARRLEAGRSALEVLTMSDGDISMRLVFEDSYRSLDAATARALRALGLQPTEDFSDELVAALGGTGETGDQVRRRLLEANLLESAAAGRCRMISLVHQYAKERAHAEDSPAEHAAVLSATADWYLWRAGAVAYQVSRRWRCGTLFADPARLRGVFDDEQQALDAFAADEAGAASVVELAFKAGWFEKVCQLVEALRDFYFRRKHHVTWIALCETAVEAARHLPNDLVLARMHYELAFAFLDRGTEADLDAAHRHYELAQKVAQRVGHARTLSSALEGLGQVALKQGAATTAISLFKQALAAIKNIDHPRGRALLTYHLGQAYSAAGLHQEAAEALLRARELFATLPDAESPGRIAPDSYNEARSLTRYGQARIAADRADEAVEQLESILDLFEKCDAPKEEADALLVRGDALAACGQGDRARQDWQAALAMYVRIRSDRAAEARKRLADADGSATTQGQ
ncbi:NB-ARC domain-containing protein [Streptomyces sp. NPDC048389]|uniref:NB-ARC domain-containing protein n=1 Tax=Streptomyces sp. NPDC048389 TaxID=3154622 RepID=UPI0034540EDD